jgi:hypothetical protein
MLWLSVLPSVHAQWQTENFTLKPGWNAAYLHVNASHVPLTTLLSNVPIDEVWLWKPDLSTAQFVTAPQEPSPASSRWLKWQRGFPLDASLHSLIGNAAYLVRVQDPLPGGGTQLLWSVKGKPAPPQYAWSSQGVNLIGFSTVPTNAPNFESFLNPAPNLLDDAQIYRYQGGPLSANNPSRVFAYQTTKVNRGEGFWVSETNVHNRYFGPFELSLENKSGIDFGSLRSTYSLHIRNLTGAPLSVTLSAVASEAPPAGEAAIVAQPPILIRGPFDPANPDYSFTRLSDGPKSWILQPATHPEAAVEVVLGLDRAGLSGNLGDIFAGILRFTDSLGFTQVDLPVSAIQADRTGLWVGEASINAVQHDLAFFNRTGPTPQLTGTDTSFGGVLRPFPMRLIVFVSTNGPPKLLQRVYSGFNTNSEPILTTSESVLNRSFLKQSRRLSAVHLPWSKGNTPWSLSGGSFALGTTLTTTVTTGYDDQAANPFLHTYHPDHDNRNATFTSLLERGEESYEIVRDISLALGASNDTFAGRTGSGDAVGGTYAETVTLKGKGAESKQYRMQGTLVLTRQGLLNTLVLP